MQIVIIRIFNLITKFNETPSQRSRHAREIYFRLLRSVGAKNYGLVSSDARKEAGEKILSQGVYDCAYPLGKRNRYLIRKSYTKGKSKAFLDAISERLLLIILISAQKFP